MPYPSLTFPQTLDSATRQELEQFISLLQGYLSAEHNDDGSHGDATAETLRVGTPYQDNWATQDHTPTVWVSGGDITALGSLTLGGTSNTTGGAITCFDEHGIELFTVSAEGGVSATTVLAGTLTSANGIYERSRATAVGVWAAYTPVWGASGVAPAIGNGTIVGSSMRIGTTRFFRIVVTMGGTSTYGTGSYTFSLPSAAVVVSMSQPAQMTDNSAGLSYSGFGVLSTASSISIISESAHAGIGPTSPFTFATSDSITINGFYEEA